MTVQWMSRQGHVVIGQCRGSVRFQIIMSISEFMLSETEICEGFKVANVLTEFCSGRFGNGDLDLPVHKVGFHFPCLTRRAMPGAAQPSTARHKKYKL